MCSQEIIIEVLTLVKQIACTNRHSISLFTVAWFRSKIKSASTTSTYLLVLARLHVRKETIRLSSTGFQSEHFGIPSGTCRKCFRVTKIGKADENLYARVYTHCLKHSSSYYELHNSVVYLNLTPEQVQKNYGLHSLIAVTMPRNQNTPPSAPLDPSSLNNKIKEAIQHFETTMQTQREEFQQAFHKASDETVAALKLFKDMGRRCTKSRSKKFT